MSYPIGLVIRGKNIHSVKETEIKDPGGGLDKPTDRDQRSWVFLNYSKKYFATDRNPKNKNFPKGKTLKNTLFI